MAYHIPLTNSQEFTQALLKARELAHNITLGMRQIEGTDPAFEVFPYTYVWSPSLSGGFCSRVNGVPLAALPGSQTSSTSST